MQHLHVGGGLFQLAGIVAEIAPGTVLIADAKTHPIGPLLFDLPQGGPAAGAETAGRPLNAVAHQQIDHIHRQAQIVIEPRQDLQIGRFQPFAQPLLHLRHQHLKAAVRLQQVGQFLGGIAAALVRRRGRRRGALQKAHVLQGRFGGGAAQLAPAQLFRQRLGGNGAVQPLQQQV